MATKKQLDRDIAEAIASRGSGARVVADLEKWGVDQEQLDE